MFLFTLMPRSLSHSSKSSEKMSLGEDYKIFFKIAFILITEISGVPLNFTPVLGSVASPKFQPWVSFPP